MSDSLSAHGLYSPWNPPGQNTGVGCLSLLQGIFPTQGMNPGLLHGRRILYQLSHKGSPRKLEWVAYPFLSGSSLPRNPTGVSCIAGGFFTNWTIREACVCVCVCVCVCNVCISKVEFVSLDVVVNYKLALAVGTCHLPWQGLNEVLHSCWFSIPVKGFKVESRYEILCALGKKKKQLAEQVFR